MWLQERMEDQDVGSYNVGGVASNLLELDIIIIPAFRQAGLDPVSGVTTIKPLVPPKHQAIHLFQFSESDFNSAHYESVFPRTEDDCEVTDMSGL